MTGLNEEIWNVEFLASVFQHVCMYIYIDVYKYAFS